METSNIGINYDKKVQAIVERVIEVLEDHKTNMPNSIVKAFVSGLVGEGPNVIQGVSMQNHNTTEYESNPTIKSWQDHYQEFVDYGLVDQINPDGNIRYMVNSEQGADLWRLTTDIIKNEFKVTNEKNLYSDSYLTEVFEDAGFSEWMISGGIYFGKELSEEPLLIALIDGWQDIEFSGDHELKVSLLDGKNKVEKSIEVGDLNVKTLTNLIDRMTREISVQREGLEDPDTPKPEDKELSKVSARGIITSIDETGFDLKTSFGTLSIPVENSEILKTIQVGNKVKIDVDENMDVKIINIPEKKIER